MYGTLSVCGFVNKYYAPGACTSVDAIRLLFDSYSKQDENAEFNGTSLDTFNGSPRNPPPMLQVYFRRALQPRLHHTTICAPAPD